ncbi:MAG: hypothetical protein ACK5Z2_17575 [Bacteroidota bacterium]|jgi:hypothetical protein
MKYIILLFVLISTVSCNQNSAKRFSTDSAASLENDSLICKQPEFTQRAEISAELNHVEAFNAHFNIQLIGGYYADGLDDAVGTFTNDTLRVEVEVSLYPSDLSFKLSNILLENLQVEQCMQTSMSLSDEGPHCDMENWLHHTTQWQTLFANDSGYYFLQNYSAEEERKFPEITVEQLKQASRQHCGEEWNATINRIHDVDEYPCVVGMNKIIVRISGIDKTSNEKVEKYITLIFSLGC